MPDKKRGDQKLDEGQEDTEGKSVLVTDQTSFIDEGSRTGKQFGDGGRKVADLERVGAMSPDADGEEPADPDRPATKRK